jgi:hypothetical protein
MNINFLLQLHHLSHASPRATASWAFSSLLLVYCNMHIITLQAVVLIKLTLIHLLLTRVKAVVLVTKPADGNHCAYACMAQPRA